MRFAKAHGTGNDFVVLSDPDGALDLTPALIAALCDRHRGIGGDGVLRVVRSAKHPEAVAMAGDAEWFMDYHNSDGSVAEMCGNGVRAYARYLVEAGLVAAGTDDFAIATRAGVVTVRVTAGVISVDLPRPVIGGTAGVAVAGVMFTGTCATVGNPNLVCHVPDAAALAALDLTRPPALDDAFAAGANVEFVTLGVPVDGADLHVHMRVFERGVGETLSCGSGACAVAAVVLSEAGHGEGVVAIDVPGGRLTVEIRAGTCRLTGPAVIVATGETALAAT